MNRSFVIRFVGNVRYVFQAGVAVSCLMCTLTVAAANDDAPAQALAKKGAYVTRNEKALGHPITQVSLVSKKVTANDLRILGSLKSLAKLSLWGCPISDADLQQLIELTDLKTLELTRTGVTGEGLEQLSPSIENLHLSNTKVSDSTLKAIVHFRDLKELTLANTEISDGAIDHISRLTNLEVLVLNDTYITDTSLKELKHLHKLKCLHLDFCPITDAAIQSLCELRNLKELNLTGTDISQEGLKLLRINMPGCKVFPTAK